MRPESKDANKLLAKKIATLRQDLKMSRAAFGQKLGVSQMAVYRWETEADVPVAQKLLEIGRLAPDDQRYFFFEFAGVSREEIADAKADHASSPPVTLSVVPPYGNEASKKKLADVIAVRLLKDSAAAGQPRFIDETDVDSFILVPNSREFAPHPSSLIAVRVQGDSMSPLLEDGYIAVIDTADNIRKNLYNEMVAVRDPEGAVTIKWLRSSRSDEILVAHNTSVRHQPIVITGNDGWRIIGKVVWWVGRPPKKTK